MERVAPQQRVAPLIRLPSTRLSPKEVLAVAVLVAVVLTAASSLRQYAEGPDWGLQLGQAPDGSVVALSVRGHGVAWEQHVRTGDTVLSVDSVDAHGFVGRVPEIVVADANGLARSIRPPELTQGLQLWLIGVAVLFALLGAAVYRWGPDPALDRTFLIFGGATALALASMPGALSGYPTTHFLAASSATVASAAFTTVFIWFPRPLRGARWFTRSLAVVSGGLLIPLVVLYAQGAGAPPPLETSLFAWMGGNLVIGTLLLAARALRPENRHLLAPLAFGIGLGIFPLALLDALPQALGRQPVMWAESASTTVASIPLAFAYAILRHRLFALDARLRRFIVKGCAALVVLAMFIPMWLTLRGVGLDDQPAMVVGVVLVAFTTPLIFDWTQRLLESWFYPSLGLARSLLQENGPASASSIATAFAVRSRELVPVRWTALLARERTASHALPGWVVFGCDGELPAALLADRPDGLVQDAPGTTVAQLQWTPDLTAAVCVGPRLDGSPPGGVDLETIRLLARGVLPSIEAALLRERSHAEDRFRRGLWKLACALAAIGPAEDVLRIVAHHAAALLQAETATVLRREAADGQTYAPLENMAELALEDLDALIRLDLDAREQLARARAGHVAYLNAPGRCMLICWFGEAVPTETLLVLVRQSAFTDDDARRAVEIADHARRALQRSEASARTAEAHALRRVDRLRSELISTVVHEIRNPLTAVLGYAQMLQLKAEALTRDEIARIARHIEYSATATRNIVSDLSTATLDDSGGLEVRVQDVDLAQALPSIVRTFQVLPDGDRIVLQTGEDLCTRVDPARLDQMVGNLLLNALRYGGTGPILVRAHSASASEVCIEVCDQGPGIPHEIQPRVWEKFYRGPVTAPQGSGIGLAVVRSLAELHGGRVELDSSPGRGSIFRIVLPGRAPQLQGVGGSGDAAVGNGLSAHSA